MCILLHISVSKYIEVHGKKIKSDKKVKDVGEIGVLLRAKLTISSFIMEENYRQ